MDDNYESTLKKYFKLDTFRDNQLDIIKCLVEDKRDVCAIMHTGAGKSLLYQLPAVHLNKISLIISPLISLMNDQSMKLSALNISNCCLNGTIKNKDEIKEDICKNKYRLVYTTPEYIITQKFFIEKLEENNILALITIDEAHTLSSYSADFRPAFKKLDCLREWCKNTPILALTATATMTVQKNIINILKMNNPKIIRSTFNRPNLIIKVMPKTDSIVKDILPFINKNEPVIIYCQTRKMTDDISEILENNNIVSKAYHAGMNTEDREEVHKQFCKNEISCVTATIAFGMGIDIVIRTVIHYGIPRNIESYYQEIGRAGRDNKESTCYLFYSLNDMTINNYLLNQISDETYRTHMVDLALKMKNYVFYSDCRRKYILEYFQEEYIETNCKACDNCLIQKQKITHNFAREALMLFETLNLTNNTYGAIMIINILRGSDNKKIPTYSKKSKLYGMGIGFSEQWWRIFIRMLINDEYIKETSISGGHGFILKITNKFKDWIESNTDQLIMQLPEDMLNLTMTTETTRKNKNTSTYENTYQLFLEGKSITDIAKELDYTKGTIENHIIKLYDKNYKIDLTQVNFNDEIYEIISKKISELNKDVTLKEIKNNLPEEISYLQIKLTQIRMKKENLT